MSHLQPRGRDTRFDVCDGSLVHEPASPIRSRIARFAKARGVAFLRAFTAAHTAAHTKVARVRAEAACHRRATECTGSSQ